MTTALLAEAIDAWPDLRVDAAAFTAYVAERVPEGELAQRHLRDLALAFACASGDARALGHFERDHMSCVASYLAPHAWARGRADDVAQTLRRHATEFQADMLVMGAFVHSRLRQLVLGGTTQSLLKSSPVPLFLSY